MSNGYFFRPEDDEIEDDDGFIDNLDCTWCGGEGYEWGSELGDPLWYDDNELYPCRACRGTGEREHQVLF